MTDYLIIRSNKRKRTVSFRVIDDTVCIYVPMKLKLASIDTLYNKNKEKLFKKIKKNDKMEILGKEYEINKITSPLLKRASFEILEDKFVIYSPVNYNIKKDLLNWEKVELEKIVKERVKFFVNKYNFKFSFEKNKILCKNQRTLWGSCTADNNLNFNSSLLQKRMDVIDYVIVHELCHTIHKNHSPTFWQAVADILPNYKALRMELKGK